MIFDRAETGVLDDGPRDCTVLLTDIEDSTRLWEQHPDTMESIVRDHNDLIAEVVHATGGDVARLTGDGVMALFTDGPDAVHAAVGIQRSFRDRAWPVVGALRVRIGLNTGRCTLHSGEVFGRPPNLASRLQSVGHGGQILMSEMTAATCAGRLQPTEQLLDLGRYHIRGFTDPVVVHMVVADGLPAEFPPLRTAYVGFDELPLDEPVLYGRDEALSDIEALLATHPLVTLWGAGGVGKTRLALRIAGRAGRPHRDGTRFVDLTVAREAADAADVVASALRAQPVAGESTLETVLRLLRSAQLLLVLDNCEHVLGGAKELAARMLVECPGCQILATSREPLGLRQERAIEIRPLPVPEPAEMSPEAIWTYPSVRLFVDRALQSAPNFTFDHTNARAIATACRAVDGLPLALELSAARLGVEGLGGGTLGAAEMADSIALSYTRLAPSEAALLLRLGVFSGAFSRELAAAVAANPAVANHDLDRLVRVAMVQRDDQLGRSFRLMATTREFVRAQLDDEAAEEVAWVHARVMVDRAKRYNPLLRTAEESEAVEAFRSEFAEIRAAMTHLLDHDAVDDASQLLVASFQFCLFQPRPKAYEWAARLARRIDRDHGLAPEVFGAAAVGAWFSGDTDEAVRLGLRAIDAAGTRPEASLVWARTALVDAYAFGGDIAAAAPHFIALVASLRASDELFWQINGLGHEAISMLMLGNPDAALDRAGRALQLARRLGNQDCMQWALYALGRVLESTDLAAACDAFEQAMTASREVDSRFNVSLNLVEWIAAKRRLGDHAAAASGALDLIDMLAASGNRSLLSQALGEVALLLEAVGKPGDAALVRSTRQGLPSMPRGADAVAGEIDGPAPFQPRTDLRASAMSEHQLIDYCRSELAQLVLGDFRA